MEIQHLGVSLGDMAALRVLCELASLLGMGTTFPGGRFHGALDSLWIDTAPVRIISLFGVLVQAKCCNPGLNLQSFVMPGTQTAFHEKGSLQTPS